MIAPKEITEFLVCLCDKELRLQAKSVVQANRSLQSKIHHFKHVATQ